jgi:hypothetical protein
MGGLVLGLQLAGDEDVAFDGDLASLDSELDCLLGEAKVLELFVVLLVIE